MTPLQIIERAERLILTVGTDANSSVMADSARLATEDLFPQALREAIRGGAADQNEINSLKRTIALSIVSGQADLPVSVFADYLNASIVYTDEAGADVHSYCSRFSDFINPSIPFLGYYAVEGNKFNYRAPSEEYKEFSGEVFLNCVAVPQFTTLTDNLDISPVTAERTAVILAKMAVGG